MLVHAFVIKILFNQYKEAIGVVFDRFGVRHKVFARKEVILSAGTINSPQLLMLSGMCLASSDQQLAVQFAFNHLALQSLTLQIGVSGYK